MTWLWPDCDLTVGIWNVTESPQFRHHRKRLYRVDHSKQCLAHCYDTHERFGIFDSKILMYVGRRVKITPRAKPLLSSKKHALELTTRIHLKKNLASEHGDAPTTYRTMHQRRSATELKQAGLSQCEKTWCVADSHLWNVKPPNR